MTNWICHGSTLYIRATIWFTMVLPCDDMADFDLIRRMADQRSDFAAAREAWEYFYLRHYRILMYICMSDHGYLLGHSPVTWEVDELAEMNACEARRWAEHLVAAAMREHRDSRGRAAVGDVVNAVDLYVTSP